MKGRFTFAASALLAGFVVLVILSLNQDGNVVEEVDAAKAKGLPPDLRTVVPQQFK